MYSLPAFSPKCLARYTVIFIVFLSCSYHARALDRNSSLRHFGRRVWQTDEGLPQNTVNNIIQTRDGYLWIATDGGLARFDGIQFKVFNRRNTPQLHSNQINKLYQDSHGTLWIGTADGLTSYDGTDWSILTIQNGLPSDNIFSIYEDRSGALWVLTANGLAKDKQGIVSSITTKDGLTGGNIVSVLKDADGTLWIATEDGLCKLVGGHIHAIYKGAVSGMAESPNGGMWAVTQQGLVFVQQGKIAFLPRDPSLPQSDLEALLADRHGRLWLATSYGLTVWDNGFVAHYTTRNGLPSNHIHKIYEDREGAVWVTTDRGLARVVDGHIEALTTKEGLPSPQVLDMLEDREGSLWLGTDAGGLVMLRNQKFTSYTSADGLTSEDTKAVYEDSDHAIWIGTDGGGLNRLQQRQFTAIGARDGLSSEVVLAIAGGGQRGVWAGTPDGLNHLAHGHISRTTSANGLPDDYIRSLLTDADGSLWIGTRHGLSHWQNGKISNYSTMDGLSSDFIGAMTKDAAGNLWIGTANGLDVWNHGHFSSYTKGTGLSNNIVTALYADPTDTLWVGTKGGGLNRLAGGSIFQYLSLTTIPENIYGLVTDSSGNLWISSDRGIFSVSMADLNAFADGHSTTVKILSYGTADGMPTSECSSGGHPSVWKSSDGTLWFTTPRGIASIQPEHADYNNTKPPVTIEQVAVDDRYVPSSKALVVSPGHTRYAFYYAALSFIAPQKIQFRYRLEGLDKSWIDAGNRRQAFYTNLKPGKYRFRVIAANNDGVWNETGTSFSFQVKPHIYQRIWFYCVLAILLVLIGYELYRLRMKRIELQFDATLAERNRIAREIHDTLAQGFVGISLQLEVAKRMLGETNQALKEYLDQALSLANSSLSEARRSIWDLRSQASDNKDMPARLAAIVKQAKKESNAEISFKINGAYRSIPENIANELLKIAQEATINAVRHANASHIGVQLAYEEAGLFLTISDDGHGFITTRNTQSDLTGHFGLIGMKERAKLIGANLRIESEENTGTTIILEIVI